MKSKLTPLTLPDIQQKELDTVITGTEEECLCAIHRDECLLCANGKHDEHCQKPQEFVPHFRTSEDSAHLNTNGVKVTVGSTKPDEPQTQPKIEKIELLSPLSFNPEFVRFNILAKKLNEVIDRINEL